jgi:hypothetical protein
MLNDLKSTVHAEPHKLFSCTLKSSKYRYPVHLSSIGGLVLGNGNHFGDSVTAIIMKDIS